MKSLLPLIFILIVVYGLYNSFVYKHTVGQKTQKATDTTNPHRYSTDKDRYNYILYVIDHGSSKLHFKKDEVMEGGYVSREDAPKVACYTLELSGEKCPYPYSKDAHLFFSSVCAGCHGNDGKGVNGAYPDLTRSVLLGLED